MREGNTAETPHELATCSLIGRTKVKATAANRQAQWHACPKQRYSILTSSGTAGGCIGSPPPPPPDSDVVVAAAVYACCTRTGVHDPVLCSVFRGGGKRRLRNEARLMSLSLDARALLPHLKVFRLGVEKSLSARRVSTGPLDLRVFVA